MQKNFTWGKKYIFCKINSLYSITNLYSNSIIIPNVLTDIPDGQPGGGKRSDHPIVYCEPRSDGIKKPARQVEVKKTRRMNDQRKAELARWIQHESWEEVYDGNSASGMAVKFIEVVERNIDQICPIEEVKISQFEGKITSLALQKLSRQKKWEYTKHGNSNKYKQLKKKLDERVKVEGKKALDKQIEKAKEKGSHWMTDAKRLSARPGEDETGSFILPSHISANLSARNSLELKKTYLPNGWKLRRS